MTSPPPDGRPHGEVVPLPEAHDRSPWPVVGVVALALALIGGVVVVAVAGSGSPSAAPSGVAAGPTGVSGSPGPDGTPSASPSPSPSAAAPTGPRYHADTDLCGKIPTGPLGSWVVTRPKNTFSPRKEDTGIPNSYAVECDVMADSARPVVLCKIGLTAKIYGTTSAARAAYSAWLAEQQGLDTLTGYGEVAHGKYFNAEELSYTKTSGYWIALQKENLMLTVSVSLIHDDHIGSIPRQTLLARVGPETKAILSAVPRS